MNILLLGSGGREHALAWKISQSPLLSKLFIAPGNAGTSACGTNLDLSVTDFRAVKEAVLENQIQLVVVGPEDPLVAGIHDFFLDDSQLKNIPVIGPRKDGAMLEGSKDFSKKFMIENNIPTAAYDTFDKENLADGLRFLETRTPPFVLKVDGLAAGKGVVILNDLQQAKTELNDILAGNKFGKAGTKVVIEEFLEGIELSVFVLTDGESYKILPEAKDYKRIGEGDTGLNTGGMGAVSPVDFADKNFMDKVEQQIIMPTLSGLKVRNISYKGFLFIGLMNVKGSPFVIEYNVRLGDPETEVVIPRIKSDLVQLLIDTAAVNLKASELEIDAQVAATVMMVSGGYPGEYTKGITVNGLKQAQNGLIFHAGTRSENEQVLTAGGRVLAFTGRGNTLPEALAICYGMAQKVTFKGCYYRRDIGKDLQKAEIT